MGEDSTNDKNYETELKKQNIQKDTEQGSRTTKLEAKGHQAPATAGIRASDRWSPASSPLHLRLPLGLLSELSNYLLFHYCSVSFESFVCLLINPLKN